jgi:hypothetical protein
MVTNDVVRWGRTQVPGEHSPWGTLFLLIFSVAGFLFRLHSYRSCDEKDLQATQDCRE